MAEHDSNLAIALSHDVAEVGGTFVCELKRRPNDGESNESGKVRAVRVTLRMTTEGRGSEDREDHVMKEVPVDEFGMASARIELAVPIDAPISYDGSLIRVMWQIEARTDVALARDQYSVAPVLVVPRGGLGVYARPHPLPRV